MAAIGSPVGKNGTNDKKDSLTVQCLLNAFIHLGRLKEPGQPPLKFLVCDSDPGPKTIKAIEVFQKTYMSEIGSCKLGLVEPHSDTLTRLLKSLDPPKGPYGGACPTLPERPDLDDPARDPHIVYFFDQGMYHKSGFCGAWAAKWASLRAIGKDFPYDPETRRAGPPGSDVLYAQHSHLFDMLDMAGFDDKKLIDLLGRFRLGIGHPDFKWGQHALLPKPPPSDPFPDGVRVQGGTWAAHLVVRHPGRYLHLMYSRDSAHAVAYEHEQLEKGKSRFRVADANNGQFLCNSAKSFMDFNPGFFSTHGYSWRYDEAHRLFRVKTFG
jgi:hypothetical protein